MVAEVQERRRGTEVRAKLSQSIADEFADIASSRGLLPATLAAVVIGEYVEATRHKLSMQRMVAVDMSKRMSAFSFNEEVLGKAIVEAMSNPELLKLFGDSSAPTPEAG